jgi:hypothetical protein
MLDEMETLIHSLAGVGNNIAHDLRTPLGFDEQLRRLTPEFGDPARMLSQAAISLSLVPFLASPLAVQEHDRDHPIRRKLSGTACMKNVLMVTVRLSLIYAMSAEQRRRPWIFVMKRISPTASGRGNSCKSLLIIRM